MNSWRHTFFLLLTAAVLGCFSLIPTAHGGLFSTLGELNQANFKRLRADRWRAVGKNLIISGHVYLPVGDMEIFADQVTINLESKDFEASGNIRIFGWDQETANVTLSQIADLEKKPSLLIKKITTSQDVFRNRTYSATVLRQTDNITADQVSGNLTSGYFRFDHARLLYNNFVASAESGEHLADGVIELKNGEVSACNYLQCDNAHYSLAAKNISLYPRRSRFFGRNNLQLGIGDRSVWMTNGWIKVYGLPVMWLPAFYKPKDEALGLASFQWGKTKDWGYYVALSKKFVFTAYPELSVRVHADYFEKRGFGYGANGTIATEESRTEFFAYGIYDKHPYMNDDYEKYRLDVPHARFDFRLTNLTHITPRLDFRGVFEYSSDRYFTRDFFVDRYNSDPQPSTYAALEQQFDHFSASVYMRFAVNDFYSTVEKLPEIRLDAPRQEILNTGIYYQGDLSADYLRMRWIQFDTEVEGYPHLKNYDTFRFDTTHFFYYPISNKYFSLVPRAGFKFTTYSKSSQNEMSDEELVTLFSAADPQNSGTTQFKNFDTSGGAKSRIIGEVGFELSTKIHNAWQHVRSSFLEIDGLRHVIQPYINYTFLTRPNVKPEELLYFDDIDRIDEQNFFRFGLINRLQTRSGSGVNTFFTMENFWDLHIKEQNGFSRLGNFGTILSMQVFKGLSLNTRLLLDVSGDGEVPDTYRNGKNVGQVGLASKLIEEWNIGLNYIPAPGWKFSASYNYVRPYSSRSAYSMGSTLTQVNSTGYFSRYYSSHSENATLTAQLPLTPDRRTMGRVNFVYDFQKGSVDLLSLQIVRAFHCWQLIAALEFARNYDPADPMWDVNYSITANLTGLNNEMNSVQNSLLRDLNSGDNKFSGF